MKEPWELWLGRDLICWICSRWFALGSRRWSVYDLLAAPWESRAPWLIRSPDPAQSNDYSCSAALWKCSRHIAASSKSAKIRKPEDLCWMSWKRWTLRNPPATNSQFPQLYPETWRAIRKRTRMHCLNQLWLHRRTRLWFRARIGSFTCTSKSA